MTATMRNDELIRRLVSLAGSGPKRAAGDEAGPYDWSAPHRYRPAQLRRLEAFASAAGQAVAAALRPLLRGELNLAPGPVAQHYTGRLRAELAEAADLAVTVKTDRGEPAGLLLVPAPVGRGWVERLLGAAAGGGADQADADRQLSAIERGVVLDVFSAATAAIGEASRKAGGPALACEEQLVPAQAHVPGADGDACCRVDFTGAENPQAVLASLILGGAAADALAGRTGATDRQGAQDAAKVRAHLDAVALTARVRLGRALVPLRDILSLEAGDVVLLEPTANAPAELLIHDRPALTGTAACCQGRYALQITGPAPAAGPPRPAGPTP